MAISQRWTVTINGGTRRTLASLNMRSARIEHVNMGVSTFGFSVVGDTVTGTCPFVEGDAVNLFIDSTCRFVGTVTSITTIADAQEKYWNVTVSNAWYYLERIIYQQPAVSQVLVGSSLVTTFRMSTRVTLGQDFWGNKLSLGLQIQNILAYAYYMGATGIAVATVNPFSYFPVIEARDITCAEAIRRCLGWSPNAVASFNYSTGVPGVSVVPRTGLASGSIDLLDATRQIVVEEINPRYDLTVPGVQFTFVTYFTSGGVSYPQYTDQVAGSPSASGGIYATIDLANPGSVNAEAVPAGVAAAYYASVQGSKWTGRIKITEADCSGFVSLGQVVNISNGRSEWASINGIVQTISENIDTGETTINFGPPEHLGPQDFAAMMQFLRMRLPPNGSSDTQHNGNTGAAGGGSIPGITGGGPNPAKVPSEYTTNPMAGRPPIHAAGGVNGGAIGASGTGGFFPQTLTLCDSSTIRVLTMP